ncbi:MAG: Uncharacterised protein [Formosa sp. Hel3_A1_48]|nr:MAG: Uncharacterised protein [Formosa sp. Hel3_A1_48]
MSKTLRLCIALSILPQMLIINILSKNPAWVEQYYSEALYPKISNALRFLYGWIPFSLGDLLYVTVIGYGLWWGVKNLKKLLKTPVQSILKLLSVASVLYFIFHLFWGLNYYRLPLHQKQHLNPIYTTAQLLRTTEQIIETSNAVHLKLAQNSSAVVQVPYNFDELSELAAKGYENSAKTQLIFEYKNPSQKYALWSTPLAYMGFSGYLNPLTNEAQVNWHNPKNSMPLTLAHEQAHQIGYAAENEANFIGFLVCANHTDDFFKYSGYTFALRYCLSEVYKRDQKKYIKLKERINEGILIDFEKRRALWAQYNNPLEPLFKSIYSNFLKVNAQDKGIESYSYVVGLIVGYFEAQF